MEFIQEITLLGEFSEIEGKAELLQFLLEEDCFVAVLAIELWEVKEDVVRMVHGAEDGTNFLLDCHLALQLLQSVVLLF